jgi:FkbM family methyltransferase
METELKQIKGLTMNIRPGTQDEFVVSETGYNKIEYEKPDIWLDAGANIGAFVCRFGKKVSKIISYEPDSENFNMLIRNITHNNITNAVCVNAALVGNEDETRDFYINNKTNKGTHTLIPTRGRTKITVKTENINAVLKKHNVNKIKLDIEGGEYELLKVMDLTNIEEIIMEYHFSMLKDKDKKMYYEVLDILESNGFETYGGVKPDAGNWTTILHSKKVN